MTEGGFAAVGAAGEGVIDPRPSRVWTAIVCCEGEKANFPRLLWPKWILKQQNAF
jgi:hypothetical protein